jgi:hypothetical protein
MSANTIPIARFRVGKIVSTANAVEQLTREDVLQAIGRHQAGDWGDVSEADQTKNELALKEGHRPWSVYHAASGRKFWLITEAGRRTTTVLLPEDY